MGAITFIADIPNTKMFGSVFTAKRISTEYVSYVSLIIFLPKFSLRIGSIVSTTAVCSVWLDF